MRTAGRRWILAAAGAAMVAVPGCAPLLDEILVPAGSSVVTGEIRSLDSRNGRLQVRDERSNRTETLRYDSRTRVVHRQRQYPASSLERGDVVRVRVSQDRSGHMWADHVEVRQSAQERRGSTSRVQRIDGRVLQVDTRRGYFTVEPERARATVVYVPRDVNRNEARRFERLRRGDRVRVEVRSNGAVAELVRFR
jgi:hypothetical protein